MLILVVADTHLPRFGKVLPQPLQAGLQASRPDLILHLGDFTSLDIVPLFEAYAPFDAVAGNNDGQDILARYGSRKILTLDGLRIAMVHGHAGPGRTTPERALNAFKDEQVDVILFGHSHQPLCQEREGVFLLNPGSPTDKRREAAYSYACLRLEAGMARAELHRYAGR